jgi:hypothetical protein
MDLDKKLKQHEVCILIKSSPDCTALLLVLHKNTIFDALKLNLFLFWKLM